MKDLFTKVTMTIVFVSVPLLAFAYGYRNFIDTTTATLANTTYQLNATDKPYHYLTVCAGPNNTGRIVIGGANVSSNLSAPNGIVLKADKCRVYGEDQTDWNGNLNRHYINSTVAGDIATYEYSVPVPTRLP